MKRHLLSLIILFAAAQAGATTTLDKAIVECSLTTGTSGDSRFTKFEELSLNLRQTEDADQNIYTDYVMKYIEGDLENVESDIFGPHPQLTEVIFTSANAEGDGVIANGLGDYQMIMNFDHSQVVVNLSYVDQDQDNFPTYEMTLEGEGPAFEITADKVENKLARSEEYRNGGPLLCVSHFDLDEFITE